MDAGLLLVLLDGCLPEPRPLQLLTHPDRRPAPKLRAFVDAIVRDLGPRAAVSSARSRRDGREAGGH